MQSALLYVTLPAKSTAPRAVIIVEGREVLKTYTDKLFGEFTTYKTYAGRRGFWEDDPSKVQKLIDAFKGGHNLKNALFWAGIKEMAWYRFLEAYPTFRDIKAACEASTSFGAMNTVQEGLKNKPELAFKYIEKRGDFNFETTKGGEEAPLQPTVAVAVQVNNNIDEKRITDGVRVRLAERLAERSRLRQAGSTESMEGRVQS